MIRIVTLDPYDDPPLEKLSRILYTAFGVGCEHSGSVPYPEEARDPLDAEKLLERVETVRSYADDKLLYLTQRRLKDRELPSGVAPTFGWTRYGEDRAIITTFGVKDLDAGLKAVGRHALHHLGHSWELHHCLDPRCAMYPPWTPAYAAGDAIFCPFCREKSEQKIRLAKS